MRHISDNNTGIFPGQWGFTLIELMIVVVIIGILASIGVPSYINHVKKSHARGAAADLMAASTALENIYQRTLVYPTINPVTTTTAATRAILTTWLPSEDDNFFTYTLLSSSTSYTLKAEGTGSMMTGCDLSLKEDNSRTVTASTCIITSW